MCFLVLFLTTGIGNGSTFRMIPVIFLTEAMRGVDKNNAAAVAQADKEGNTLGAATLGFTAAMAAYGGFFIPKSYGSSIALPPAAAACRAVVLCRLLPRVHVTYLVVLRPQARRDALLIAA